MEGDDEEVIHIDGWNPSVKAEILDSFLTGEEDCETLWEERMKLFRFCPESKEFKERGTGLGKIQKTKGDQLVRFLLRQEKTQKIIANQIVLPTEGFCALTHKQSDKIVGWSAQDFASEECKVEQQAAKFGTPQKCQRFKKYWKDGRKSNARLLNEPEPIMSETEYQSDAEAPKEEVKSTETGSSSSLGSPPAANPTAPIDPEKPDFLKNLEVNPNPFKLGEEDTKPKNPFALTKDETSNLFGLKKDETPNLFGLKKDETPNLFGLKKEETSTPLFGKKKDEEKPPFPNINLNKASPTPGSLFATSPSKPSNFFSSTNPSSSAVPTQSQMPSPNFWDKPQTSASPVVTSPSAPKNTSDKTYSLPWMANSPNPKPSWALTKEELEEDDV